MYTASEIDQGKLTRHVLNCYPTVTAIRVIDGYIEGKFKSVLLRGSGAWRAIMWDTSTHCRSCGEDMKLIHFSD